MEDRQTAERVQETTRLLREQISESPIMARDTMDSLAYRYAFAVGSLLAFVPDEEKAELMLLIRHGGRPQDPAESSRESAEGAL